MNPGGQPQPDEEKGEIDHHGNTGFSDLAISVLGDNGDNPVAALTTPMSTSAPSSGDSTTPLTGGLNWPTTSKILSNLRRNARNWMPHASRSTKPVVPLPVYKPDVRKIHKTPHGYPRLAAFLDSDDNFMVYRRFGYLQSRLLLEKQDSLRQLEAQLEQMDFDDVRQNPNALVTRENGSETVLDALWSLKRKALLARTEKTFAEYATLLTSAQTLTAMNKPSSGEHRSVWNWINNKKPVDDADASFIDKVEDLVTLRPGREHAWLDAGVEKVLQKCKFKPLQEVFRSEETKLKSDGTGKEVYYTRQRIERLVIVLVAIMILVLLTVPVWILYHLTAGNETSRSYAICIGVLLIFTLIFSACTSLFTRAKRHEILAASAAYCAILVVFIGNVNGRGGNGFAGNSSG